MKTVIVWVEYQATSKPSVEACEYATFGKNSDYYRSASDFLEELKKLARFTGYKLVIKNVVIG